jgi:hypothetical protein
MLPLAHGAHRAPIIILGKGQNWLSHRRGNCGTGWRGSRNDYLSAFSIQSQSQCPLGKTSCGNETALSIPVRGEDNWLHSAFFAYLPEASTSLRLKRPVSNFARACKAQLLESRAKLTGSVLEELLPAALGVHVFQLRFKGPVLNTF